jgi:tryptophan-rich sensory protein
MCYHAEDMKKSKILAFVAAILICQSAGFIGSFFTVQNIPTWYAALEKPFFQPPNWIFGPVWLLLYTLMGISVAFLWLRRKSQPGAGRALKLFGIHLILNALWSPLFFGWHQLDWSFALILVIWAFIIVLYVQFYRLYKPSAYLLVPYFCWVSFAAVLNFAIWQLNS